VEPGVESDQFRWYLSTLDLLMKNFLQKKNMNHKIMIEQALLQYHAPHRR